MTLRERKKAQTRDGLAEAALRLFADRGFEKVTVDEIAAAADVSRRTYFRYFSTKEAVVFPDRERRLLRFGEMLADRPHGEEPFESVRLALMALARDYEKNRARVLLQQRIVEESAAVRAYDAELDRQWERTMAASLGDVDRAPAADRRRARLGAGALMGAIRAILNEWYAGAGRGDLKTLGQEAFDLLTYGMNATIDSK
jgi:AcrR family transcriptional regulator